ncbi:hypothetical protein BH23CHL6_BH23CHL6_11610 [soil metagenome]
MIRHRDHARYRELISARLESTLTEPETAELVRHLAECGRCRAAEHAYRAQRQQLRTWRTPSPPRDMWARTSAALDREIVRQGGYSPPGRQLRHVLAGGAAVASVAALGLSIGLVSTQLRPLALPQTPGVSAQPNVRPTPYAVPPEALAFLGSSAQGLTVYRTRVDRVCPAAAIDCMDYDANVPALVALPRDMQPSNLALSPNGGRLAIEGRDSSGDDVIAVAVMPADGLGQPIPMDAPAMAAATASATTAPKAPVAPATTVDALRHTPQPVASASVSPDATPAYEPSPQGPPEVSADPTLEPTLDAGEAVPTPSTETPLAPVASATATGMLPEPTVEPGDSPASGEATVEPSEATAVPVPLDPEDSPAASSAPGLPSPVAGEVVLAILEDVRSVGAPAAWSADGSALAFSAMPTDGSHGPDVYLWRAGDQRARLLTTDHQSYFASWAGSRVVVSRVASPDDGATEGEAGPEVTTVVIDPLAGEERTAMGGEDLWLPAINPLGTTLVVWHGSLQWSGNEVAPVAGALYSGEWSHMDPFAIGRLGDGTTELLMEPIEPDRDPVARPVHDWQIRWSPDGQVLGYWIADVPGASWGQLAVVAVDRSTGILAHDQPLLGPSLARRAFTLGLHRVAWVAPADEEPQGELRLMTWGPDGVGGLRLRLLGPR